MIYSRTDKSAQLSCLLWENMSFIYSLTLHILCPTSGPSDCQILKHDMLFLPSKLTLQKENSKRLLFLLGDGLLQQKEDVRLMSMIISIIKQQDAENHRLIYYKTIKRRFMRKLTSSCVKIGSGPQVHKPHAEVLTRHGAIG